MPYIVTVNIAVELETLDEQSTSIYTGAIEKLQNGEYTTEIEEVK